MMLLSLCAVVLLAACTAPSGGGTTTTMPPTRACTSFDEVPLLGGAGQQPSVTPDGRWVAYRTTPANGMVRVVDRAGGRDTAIGGSLRTDLSYFPLQISSDGERVGVVGRTAAGTPVGAWIIDRRTGVSTQLDWSGVDFPPYTYLRGFSDDLSAFVTRWTGATSERIIPSDGGPVRAAGLPGGVGSAGHLDADASVIGVGTWVWDDGVLREYPGPRGDVASVTDVNRAGTHALVSTDVGTFWWRLSDGLVEAVDQVPGEVTADPGWARASEDGRYVVRSATAPIDGVVRDGTWRVDRVAGTATPLPAVFDGITAMSDDGRVLTSTNAQIFVCAE